MTPVEIRTEGNLVVAIMPAEIDLANAELISDHVLSSVPNEAGGLLVDLTPVTYLDSTGIRMLLRFARRTSASRQRLALLVGEGSSLLRLLKMANMEEAMPIFPSLEQASSWVNGSPSTT